MITTKLSTFILGCLLLSPFFWSFGQMIFHDSAVAVRTARERIEAMMKEQGLEEMQDGKNSNGEIPMSVSAFSVEPSVVLHRSLYGVWCAAPRRWVGWVGMTCCLVILGLWAFSSFSRVSFSSGMLTSKVGQPASDDKVRWDDDKSVFINPPDPPESKGSK